MNLKEELKEKYMKLTINSLTKAFADKVVLDSFNEVINDGEIVLLEGESGAGKSTLIRIISGLDKDYSGTVDPENYSVSVAFQEPLLYPGCDALANLCTVADKEKSIEILRELNFTDSDMHLYPSELSGGMAKRVSVARALLFPADIYLFDEPFAGLDAENVDVTANVICRYLKNKTAIIASHIHNDSWNLFDRSVKLKGIR